MNQKLLLLVVIFSISLQIVYGLECWQCTELSTNGEGCGDPFTNSTGKAKCSYLEVCVKHSTVKIAHGDVKLPSFVTRGCSPPGFCSSDIKDVAEHCSTCTTDLCNSAMNIIPTFALTVVLVINFVL